MIGEICKSPHIQQMIDLKDSRDVKVYAEIGVLYGGSMIEQMKSEKECFFIGIDPFTGYYGNSYDPHRSVDLTEHLDIVKKNLTDNNPHGHEWELIKNPSNDAVEELKSLLAPYLLIDLLFIDGDHSYQAVKDDFENYKDLIAADGILVFDNYKDPNWTEVETAVIDIMKENTDYFIKEEFGHCCIVAKQNRV